MRIRTFFGAVMAMSSVAGAEAPLRLAPSSPWIVDYAENSCRLIRHFGQGDDEIVFALESEAPGAVDMMIAGKPLATALDQVPAKFLPLQIKPMLGEVGVTVPKHDPLVLWSSTVRLLPDDVVAAEEEAAAERRRHPEIRPPAVSVAEQEARKALRESFATKTTAIEIDARKRRPVILETGSLGAPIKTFDKCNRDSLRSWGVDPDVEDKIVRPVWAPNPAAWFSSSDYPKTREESVVKVRLLVDAAGRVTKCTSLSHFNEPEFNKVTCDKFSARAHFEPAELADGSKVPSYYVNKVIFRLER